GDDGGPIRGTGTGRRLPRGAGSPGLWLADSGLWLPPLPQARRAAAFRRDAAVRRLASPVAVLPRHLDDAAEYAGCLLYPAVDRTRSVRGKSADGGCDGTGNRRLRGQQDAADRGRHPDARLPVPVPAL